MKADKAGSSKDAEERDREICKLLGIPYWKDHSKYPKDTEKTTDEEWRWEFLRRDRNYQDDWKKLCIGEFSEIDPENLLEYGLAELEDPTKSYKQLKHKNIFQKYPAIIGEHEIVEWKYADLSEHQDKRIWGILHEENSNLVSVQLNIHRPITPQIDQLQKILENKQKKILGKILRHRVSDNTTLYLRAADAIRIGVDNTTIGIMIFGCQSKHSADTRARDVRKKLKQLWKSF